MSLLQSRPKVVTLFAFAALFAWGTFSVSEPIGRVSQEDEQGRPYAELVVVSWNINHGEGIDGRYSIERIARTLAQYEPDIIGLQEVDMSSRRSNKDKQAEILARRLRMHFVFGRGVDHLGGEYGNTILSKYPIVSSNNADISPEKALERLSLLRTTIDVKGKMLAVYVVHFGSQERKREYQVRRVMDVLNGLAHDGPMLLMGDMEMDPPEDLMLPVLRRLSHPGGRCGPDFGTYPSSLLSRRHDYIFGNKSITALDCMVADDSLSAAASDHLPLVATVRIELF